MQSMQIVYRLISNGHFGGGYSVVSEARGREALFQPVDCV